jgi:hypothetical protein
MRIYGRRPLTRLEAALYAGIVAILIAVFASQLLDYMEIAERSAMQATIGNLIAAINTRLAYGVMRGEVVNVSAWARRNPFELAKVSPSNFTGEVDVSTLGSLERGRWAYDVSRAELVYLPRLRRSLETSDPDGILRFRAVVDPRGFGYALVPTPVYRWN